MGIRKFKKSVAKNNFLFPLEMYTSLPGSIIITSYILNNEKPDLKEIRKRWKYFLRHGLGFSLSDKDYIQKVCKAFDVEMFDVNYAAFVQSDFNALICPFVDGVTLPLREDGHRTRTLLKGKVYPLKEYEDGKKDRNEAEPLVNSQR